MKKYLNQFLIISIYFFTPLAFSYLPDLLGIHFLPHSNFSYERVKVITFLFLFFTLFFLNFGFFKKSFFELFDFRIGLENKENTSGLFGLAFYIRNLFYAGFPLSGEGQKHVEGQKEEVLQKNSFKEILKIISLLIVFSFIFSFIGSQYKYIAFFGYPSKLHGVLFFLSLFGLFLFLSNKLRKDKKFIKLILNSIFLSLIGIGFYSLIQFFGLDPLQSKYITRVSLDRVFSTLGNANYLAGYGLILLPFFNFFSGNKKYIFAIICLFLIILSQSLIGIFLAGIYLIFLIFRKIKNYKLRLLFSSFILFFLVILLIYFLNKYNIDNIKFKGFLARFYLWKTGFNAIFDNFKTFLFGYGSDTFILNFNHFRDPMLSVYEDNKFVADSSHNIFIDILYSFGLIGFLSIFSGIFLIIKKNYRSINTYSIILFLLFFSFNIPISVHFLVLIFALSLNTIEN